VAAAANKLAGKYVVDATAAGATIAGYISLSNTPDKASSLLLTAPLMVTAGSQFSLTVTAVDQYGNTATGYNGTVVFSSSDSDASLPMDYTFVAADNGSHTFQATLNTAGSQTLTVGDTVTPSLTSTATLTVSAKKKIAVLPFDRASSSVRDVAKAGLSRAKPRHSAHHGAFALERPVVNIRSGDLRRPL
jgi:hypothetical protein